MFTSKKKEAARTAVRLSLKVLKVTLYLCMVLVHTALTWALKASEWTLKQLGTNAPKFKPRIEEEDMYYECKSETITQPEPDIPSSEGCSRKQDGGGDTPQDTIPNCFEGTPDLSGTLPFAVSNLTKEVRDINAGRDGIAA